MAKLPRSIQDQCGWLRSDTPADDLVISSRIRLARNIEGFPFSQWASSADLKRIAETSKEAIDKMDLLNDATHITLENLESIDRHFLAERYLISREFAKSGIERYLVINPMQEISIMINEEDHLRLQTLMGGANLRRVWERINAIDNQIEDHLQFSFSDQYGYLTACPTNLGTGIRCSVMVHLPALVISRKIEQIFNAVTQIGLTVRGLAGEGSDIIGNLFQISNQWTLGISEEETIQKIENILEQIIDQERKEQQRLMDDNPVMIEDRVWRAYGTLQNARTISSSETIELLSTIRLGRSLGILNDPSYETINEMVINIRPAHLQKSADRQLSASERDQYRAEYLRKWMKEISNT